MSESKLDAVLRTVDMPAELWEGASNELAILRAEIDTHAEKLRMYRGVIESQASALEGIARLIPKAMIEFLSEHPEVKK